LLISISAYQIGNQSVSQSISQTKSNLKTQ